MGVDNAEGEPARPALTNTYESTPRIISSDGAVRYCDASDKEAIQDRRFGEQIGLLIGQRLYRFSMSVSGIRLTLWGEPGKSTEGTIAIETDWAWLRGPGDSTIERRQWNEPIVATSLLDMLQERVTRIEVDAGHLTLAFERGHEIRVDPDDHYEAWQISSDTGLLVVCTPEGRLSVWFPDAQP